MKRSTRNLSLLLIITAAAAWFYQDTLVGFWHQTTGTSAARAPTDGAVNKGGDARKDGKGGKGDKAETGGRPGGRFGGPTAVGVVTVALADLPTTLEATGSIIALQSVPLRAQVNALIKRVAVKEGQNVRAGTLLFVLDDRSVQADLSKAQAQAARSKASLADLQRQLTRAQDLLKKNFVAASAVDTAASQVEAQKGQVTA
ncbi:MAG: biotin/lipoyl-binding protein, partial [Burkholderiaceae bacterium]